jgi:hypothetical protein
MEFLFVITTHQNLQWRITMVDNRGKGPDTDEGRVEKNPSRPYENSQAKEQQQRTNDRASDAQKKK